MDRTLIARLIELQPSNSIPGTQVLEKAKDDAKEALALELTWAKAHYCLGMAMHGLHNVEASNNRLHRW